jgi:hypothetical protein
MTAEVAVINDSAVALAADSLVTVTRPGHTAKTYHANKLFTFAKHAPVGVMIYGNANIMGVPWETVIKQFRRILGREIHDTIEEYAEHFIDYIAGSNVLFPEERQDQWFCAVLQSYFENLKRKVDKSVQRQIASVGPIDDAKIKQIAAETIMGEHDKFQSIEKRKALPSNFGQKLTAKFRSEVGEAISTAFGGLPLTTTARRQLISIAAELFARDYSISVAETGIVVAGFGDKECFPSAIGFRIHGIVGNEAIYTRKEDECFSGPGCAVLPFAQRDVVDSFLQGIDGHTQTLFTTVVSGILDEFTKTVAENAHVSKSQKTQLVDRMNDGAKNALSTLSSEIRNHLKKQHVDPLLEAVAVLPKEDLAVLAESLVDLTSIKRKVSHGVETVGGPTDVAVISKGDGFVWIRRKHYFDAKINPQFSANYLDR